MYVLYLVPGTWYVVSIFYLIICRTSYVDTFGFGTLTKDLRLRLIFFKMYEQSDNRYPGTW